MLQFSVKELFPHVIFKVGGIVGVIVGVDSADLLKVSEGGGEQTPEAEEFAVAALS